MIPHLTRVTRTLAIACPLGASLAAFDATAAPRHSLHTDKSEFAYVVNNGSSDISVYHVDSETGALNQVPGSPFGAGRFPDSIAIDRFTRFAYVANYGS